jgi:hypothetical protein
MSDIRESITIFYKLKLKRTHKPIEVFEKMAKAVKKRGATKNWSCNYDEQSFAVDFGDELSETFELKFDDKKICDDFCKVAFPLSGELFDDDKKSEFKALINMIYSARTSFSEMDITDDYGISESFLDTKVNKIVLRELDTDELVRAKRLFDEGHTNVREFITALMFDLRGLPYSENFLPYINPHLGQSELGFWYGYYKLTQFYEAFTESFLYETTEYMERGRLFNIPDYYGELNGVFFSVSAFKFGILDVTDLFHLTNGCDPKSTQVFRLYHNKYLPLEEQEIDPFGKCLLAYRFFVSILNFLGFRYVGRADKNIDYISNELVVAIKKCVENYNHENYEVYKKALGNELIRTPKIKLNR